MKIRAGFVSNSSSCSFTIINKTGETKTLVDFVTENPEIVDEFKEQYGYKDSLRFTQEMMLKSAENRDIRFVPRESKICTFGDEDGDIIGHVYDYMLRDGGSSESFTWNFYEMLR
jgi:hypothetical protein